MPEAEDTYEIADFVRPSADSARMDCHVQNDQFCTRPDIAGLGRPHRGAVFFEAVGEGVQGGQRAGADGVDPWAEVGLPGAAGQHGGEAVDVADGGCQSGAGVQQPGRGSRRRNTGQIQIGGGCPPTSRFLGVG